jgi:hypothetical protein
MKFTKNKYTNRKQNKPSQDTESLNGAQALFKALTDAGLLRIDNPSLDWVKIAEGQGVPATQAADRGGVPSAVRIGDEHQGSASDRSQYRPGPQAGN